MRGAAEVVENLTVAKMISTHAPHARRGTNLCYKNGDIGNFYSRASCEARPLHANLPRPLIQFLLTRLMRGAANILYYTSHYLWISTHAPHAWRGYS